MNTLALQPEEEFDPVEETDTSALIEAEKSGSWVLKKLKPKHMEALAFVAQGKTYRDVARIVGFTPEYISMLMRQPLAREYLATMNEIVGVRLEALFDQSVEVIADTMQNGSRGEKLKAVRLQLEATKRLGRGEGANNSTVNADERLVSLSERLVGLLAQQKAKANGNTVDSTGALVEDASSDLRFVNEP